MKRWVTSPDKPSIRCSSDKGANVATDKAWVCPRVNKPEPCVRGNKPTSEANGRISSILRPSGRTLSSVIKRRTSLYSNWFAI